MEDDRFYTLDWCDADHTGDLKSTMLRGALVPIVDEKAGGIIAYAIGEDHARMIVATLMDVHS